MSYYDQYDFTTERFRPTFPTQKPLFNMYQKYYHLLPFFVVVVLVSLYIPNTFV